jgi:hypothetical protein
MLRTPIVQKIADIFHHDVTIYAPDTNELFFSDLSPNVLSQSMLKWATDPPILDQQLANPLISSVEGGVFYNGLIYYETSGDNTFYHAHPGV